jgi:hypothetical protein
MDKIQNGGMVMTWIVYVSIFLILINKILIFIKITKNIHWVHLTISIYKKN